MSDLAQKEQERCDEIYGCTVCYHEYSDFIEAICCCDHVDKQGQNYFILTPDWSDIT